MSINTRASVLFIVPEVTEGTPVAPSAAGQAVALQDDFSMAPNYESLETVEMQSSLGRTKPIQGQAAPAGQFSHYLRASGIAGTAPGFKELLKTVFTEVAASTEYDTVASSAVDGIKVDTGEGANYQRGQALLIKDATNGYRIRCLASVDSDDLIPIFNVPVAPGSGVNLGKAVLYKPKETGHGTFCLWHYLGNGGGIQLMTGVRVTGIDISANAGELLNASYSFEGVDYGFDPILITSSTRYIDWTDDTGTFAAAITAGFYHDPHEVAEALQSAMNAANPAEAKTVTYSNSTGKFTIKSEGTVLTLKWNTGTNTANTIGTKIGFVVASDDSGTAATTGYTSDNAQSFAAPYTPDYDDNSDPVAMKNQEIMIGSATDYACFGASTVSINIGQDKADIKSICAASGRSGTIITGRNVEIQVSAVIEQYDAEQFKNFRTNAKIGFQFSFGEKSGGNWVEGKCGAIAAPAATITAWELTDEDGTAFVSMTIVPYVEDGNGEIYINTL